MGDDIRESQIVNRKTKKASANIRFTIHVSRFTGLLPSSFRLRKVASATFWRDTSKKIGPVPGFPRCNPVCFFWKGSGYGYDSKGNPRIVHFGGRHDYRGAG